MRGIRTHPTKLDAVELPVSSSRPVFGTELTGMLSSWSRQGMHSWCLKYTGFVAGDGNVMGSEGPSAHRPAKRELEQITLRRWLPCWSSAECWQKQPPTLPTGRVSEHSQLSGCRAGRKSHGSKMDWQWSL